MLLGPLRAHPYCSCSLSRVSTGHSRRPSPTLSRAAAADVEWEAPWTAIFDLRERDQFWGDAQQGALVKAFAARELGLDEDAVERELHKLAALLPDIGRKVKDLHPSILSALLRDPDKVAMTLVQLREFLPHANVSQLVARMPALLLKDGEQTVKDVNGLSQLMQLDPETTQRLVSNHPGFLDLEGVQDAMEQIAHLMPGSNPRRTLKSDPSWLLRVQRGTKHLGAHPDT